MNHRKISVVKSGLRLVGYGLIIFSTYSDIVFGAFIALALAEVAGIIEEFVPARKEA